MKSAIKNSWTITTKGLVCGTCVHHKDGVCRNDMSNGLKVGKKSPACTHHQDCKMVKVL